MIKEKLKDILSLNGVSILIGVVGGIWGILSIFINWNWQVSIKWLALVLILCMFIVLILSLLIYKIVSSSNKCITNNLNRCGTSRNGLRLMIKFVLQCKNLNSLALLKGIE